MNGFIQLSLSHFSSVSNRVFPKIDHSVSSARIVLEQINSTKKLPLTGIEPATLGLNGSLLVFKVSCHPN